MCTHSPKAIQFSPSLSQPGKIEDTYLANFGKRRPVRHAIAWKKTLTGAWSNTSMANITGIGEISSRIIMEWSEKLSAPLTVLLFKKPMSQGISQTDGWSAASVVCRKGSAQLPSNFRVDVRTFLHWLTEGLKLSARITCLRQLLFTQSDRNMDLDASGSRSYHIPPTV